MTPSPTADARRGSISSREKGGSFSTRNSFTTVPGVELFQDKSLFRQRQEAREAVRERSEAEERKRKGERGRAQARPNDASQPKARQST